MEANELRIGNWVNLTKDNFKTVKPYQIFDSWDLYKLEDSDCADIKPIPLTEEWLVKFGFKSKEDEIFFTKGDVRVFFYDIWNVQLKIREDWVTILQLYDLHEFQNAFKVLTGKELQLCN